MVGIITGCRKQQEYERWLRENGLTYRIVSSLADLDEIRVAVFCGGPDLGENPARDALDRLLFDACLVRQIALWGGCRGMQEIAYFLQDAGLPACGGSSLIPDLGVRNQVHRTQPDDASRFHDIRLSDGRTWRVNSRHHQAVRQLPFPCQLTAQWLPDEPNGAEPVWELMRSTDDRFLLVQCHPELVEMRGSDVTAFCIDWLRSKC